MSCAPSPPKKYFIISVLSTAKFLEIPRKSKRTLFPSSLLANMDPDQDQFGRRLTNVWDLIKVHKIEMNM